MKRYFYAWLGVAILCGLLAGCGGDDTTPAPAPQAGSAPTDNMIAYYPFSGNANDNVGSYNGVVSGASLVADRFGVANSAYHFNGTNSVITAPQLNTGTNLTVAAWVKMDAINTGLNFIVGNVNVTPGFYVFQNGDRLGLSISVPSTNSAFSSTGKLANTWYHVVGTYDGTDIKCYVNGVLEGTTNHPGTISTSSNLLFGNFSSSFWPGTLDDVRIYNRVLTQAEITALYNYHN